MNITNFNSVVKKNKKCPSCGSSWKEDKLQCSLEDEIITINCECGFLKRVDENNKEVN